jgi:hypothetical protein
VFQNGAQAFADDLTAGIREGLLVEKPDQCNKILVDFLTLDPIATFAPIRRA